MVLSIEAYPADATTDFSTRSGDQIDVGYSTIEIAIEIRIDFIKAAATCGKSGCNASAMRLQAESKPDFDNDFDFDTQDLTGCAEEQA